METGRGEDSVSRSFELFGEKEVKGIIFRRYSCLGVLGYKGGIIVI